MANISSTLRVYSIFSNIYGSDDAMKIMRLIDNGKNRIKDVSLTLEVYEIFRKNIESESAKDLVLILGRLDVVSVN